MRPSHSKDARVRCVKGMMSILSCVPLSSLMNICARGAPLEEGAIHFDAMDFSEGPGCRGARLCGTK